MRLSRKSRSRAIAASLAILGALIGARPVAAAVPSAPAPADVSETAIKASNQKVSQA
jgi:hypothetical protein